MNFTPTLILASLLGILTIVSTIQKRRHSDNARPSKTRRVAWTLSVILLLSCLAVDSRMRPTNVCSIKQDLHAVDKWKDLFASKPAYFLCMSDLGYPVFKHPHWAFFSIYVNQPFGLAKMGSTIGFPLTRVYFVPYKNYYNGSSYPTESLIIRSQIDQIKAVLDIYENSFETLPAYDD